MKNNIFHVSIPLSGLIKREEYSYEILNIISNWPVSATPRSGVFTASAKTKNIDTTINFFPTTGLALNNANVFDYDLSSCGYQDAELFCKVYVKATAQSDNTEVLSEQQHIICTGCLPSISVQLTGCNTNQGDCNQYELLEDNVFDFDSFISGIEPNTKYNYTISSVGANWPIVMVTPISGSFVSNVDSYKMQHKLLFCPNNGSNCGSNVLDYDIAQCFNMDNKYANVQLSLAADYCANELIYSNPILVNCNNCLPSLQVTLPDEILLTSGNVTTITANISGLSPGNTYTYTYNTIDSNWPAILKPKSGSFVATKSTYDIDSQFMFCYPSGNCQNGTPNLLPYTLDTLAEKTLNRNQLQTQLSLTVSSTCTNNEISNICDITCDNCFPCVRYANVLFSGSPQIILTTGCCQSDKFISVDVSNAIPGDAYEYQFTSTNNSFVFTPNTGTAYFGGNGVGSIDTILSVDLVENDQELLNFEMTHVNTNTKIYDTVGIVCGNTGCP